MMKTIRRTVAFTINAKNYFPQLSELVREVGKLLTFDEDNQIISGLVDIRDTKKLVEWCVDRSIPNVTFN
jgi:hypothetical protein